MTLSENELRAISSALRESLDSMPEGGTIENVDAHEWYWKLIEKIEAHRLAVHEAVIWNAEADAAYAQWAEDEERRANAREGFDDPAA